MHAYSSYSLNESLFEDFPHLLTATHIVKGEKKLKLSNKKIITTGIFDLFPELFLTENPQNSEEYCCLVGRSKGKRCYRWISHKYINCGENYYKYKVILSKSNGSGELGEALSSPFIAEPFTGFTQTFLCIGAFDTKKEAENAMKYIKTKFARVMLGVLKVTQDNPPEKWRYVPLQDFTAASDIDWSASIPDIDRQLYNKYGLSQEEIDFIEEKVRAMD